MDIPSIQCLYVGFRARVQVQAGAIHDGNEFPYKLIFQAIAREKSAGPIELKHRGSNGDEFIWIEAGHFIAHYSQDNNPFEIRDKSSNPMFNIVLFKKGPQRHTIVVGEI